MPDNYTMVSVRVLVAHVQTLSAKAKRMDRTLSDELRRIIGKAARAEDKSAKPKAQEV